MKYFLALPKDQVGFYLIGQLSHNVPKDGKVLATQVVRLMEMADQSGRMRYSLVPDPFFTTDHDAELSKSDMLMYRETSDLDSEGVLKEYQSMLVQLRLKKSGLVSGQESVNYNKKILQESL